ncbi:hypothetical protein SAMN05421690_10171 [Nitrosomonas sp. Nm51]|uniref:hypothetical protein n=1 Tax=Nitrosomonas sp. Nm51 TaxID=133720 RepID=UPI0008B355C2|nr:hypothetical protein [Nitrosomonas sp. Nm51]SER28711.1 hypothetical protein SAMN05421690_10171 [Nitrosomonas sp. Nm51]
MTEVCTNINGTNHRLCLKKVPSGHRLFIDDQEIAFLPSSIDVQDFKFNEVRFFMIHKNNQCEVRLADESPLGGGADFIPRGGSPVLIV